MSKTTRPPFSWKRMVITALAILGVTEITLYYLTKIDTPDVSVLYAAIAAVAGLGGFVVKKLTDGKQSNGEG